MASLSQMGYNVPAAEGQDGFSSGFSNAPPMMGVATGGVPRSCACSGAAWLCMHMRPCPGTVLPGWRACPAKTLAPARYTEGYALQSH